MSKISFSQYFAICSLGFFMVGNSSVMANQTLSPRTSKAPNKIVFQVTDGDTQKWNLTLVNAINVIAELGKQNVAIEIVVYGPAIDMLKLESEVAPRVDEVISSGVKVVACGNTMRGLHITAADMLPDIHYTRTGVVYLMKKQKEGYAYIRP
ncbi:MAG: DsrE family protein [Pseudomonadota bacterium]|nr:DsrE family protein [Gammaproteobacteria bacterium]MBU1732524.1 DsrE family protein [Gammaproteobacteria bacterium]MBU1892660.1 DsrE family protein [Gammaproteobacteria bacterium]